MGEETKPEMTPDAPKVYTLEDVTSHNTLKDCWLVIHGKVYDVTPFMDEHPGGDEVMLSSTGKDATDDFEDVGHSTSARKDLDKYYIGEFDMSSLPTKVDKATVTSSSSARLVASSSIFTTLLQFLVPVAILALAVAVRFLTKKGAEPKVSTL